MLDPRRSTLAATVLLAVAVAGPATAAAAPCPDATAIHDPFTALLARRVHDGRVDYSGLKDHDAPALDAYLASLARVSRRCLRSWSSTERFAFWINAYNAFTLRLVLDHHPIDSIRSIGWLPGSAFRQAFIVMPRLRKEPLSLNTIEHEILRPEFRDARVHFAIVCASTSCPALRSEAYRAADLERQLDDQTRTFLADPAKNGVDATTRALRLSSIFRWFEEDFDRDTGSIARFVARFAPPQMAALAATPGVRIEYLDYDWSLNGR